MKPPVQPLEETIAPADTRSSDKDRNASSNTLNSPEIGKDGKPTQRAVTSASQAYSIAKNLRDKAKGGRIKTAATIAQKYNGEPPFNEQDLSKTGQAWRNNFSTNFLASIIDRVKPQMLDPINKADVLTHSVLPPQVENAATKSRKFCEATTKVIRRWPAWRDFASQLSQENVLFGNAVPAWLDGPTEWRPRLWKFDECYLPDGTSQHASTVQVAVFEQKMLIHEFIQLFADRDVAEKAGYTVDNCIVAANKSKPNNQRKTDETDLQKQDRLREGAGLADSSAVEAKTVDLYHVLVRDYTGGVDLWTVTQDEGLEIRNIQDLHEQCEDALTLFTFQSGNGKLYGSKGLGRLLTNLHIAIERGRCLGADQMYLSGLIIFKTDKKDAASLQARVRHPFVFVSKDMEVITEQIQFNVQAFEMMDAKLTQLAESIAGAFIPPNLNQEGANTKIEAAQNAERELAVKEGVLGRFFDHLADLIGAMQRKIYSPINLREGKRAFDKKIERQQSGVKVLMRRVWKLLKAAFKDKEKSEPDITESGIGMADEEAVAAVVELLEAGLTVEDIAMLALSPAAVSNATDGAAKDNTTLLYIANNRQNPFIDQKAATEMEARIAIGEDRAKQLVVQTDDPQVEAIALRQQLIELSEMMDTVPMPVAASDKHATHRKVIAAKIESIMQICQQAPTPKTITAAKLILNHYGQHVQMDALMPPDQKKTEMQGVIADLKTIASIEQAVAKQQEELAKQGLTVEGTPVPVNGQPPQVGPDGRIVGEAAPGQPGGPAMHPEDVRMMAEAKKLDQEDQRIALEHRALDLEEQRLNGEQTLKGLSLQQDNMRIVQDAARDTQAAGEREADRELEAMMAKAGRTALPITPKK